MGYNKIKLTRKSDKRFSPAHPACITNMAAPMKRFVCTKRICKKFDNVETRDLQRTIVIIKNVPINKAPTLGSSYKQ